MHLAHYGIGTDGALALAKALKINQTVVQLDLEDNWIGEDGMRAVAEALKFNHRIALLDVSRNHIGLVCVFVCDFCV